VNLGDQIVYTIDYANTGFATATQVMLTQKVPVHTSYVPSGWDCLGATCTQALGALAPGDSGVTQFVVQVDSLPLNRRIDDEVRIGGAEEDLYPLDNVAYEESRTCRVWQGEVYLPLLYKHVDEPEPTPEPTAEPSPEPTPEPGEDFVKAVAVNPETGLVYVASPDLNAVLAVNPAGTGSILAQIPTGDHPMGLAVVTTSNKIYASNLEGGSVTPIRGSDHTALPDIPVGVMPAKAAADSGDARVYVSLFREVDLSGAAIDSLTDSLVHHYTRGHAVPGPYGIAVDGARDRLFFAARDGGLIAIQNANAPDLDPQIFKLDPPRVPYVLAFNPTTGHLFVTAADDNLVVVLDPAAIQWHTARWTTWRGQRVFFLDRTNAGWIKEIPVGDGAEDGIAVNPVTGYVYVANADSDTLTVIQDSADPALIRHVTDLPAGEQPRAVAVDINTNIIYVGNSSSRDLTVFDGSDHSYLKTIPLE
jgi:uncharacterized repeat protein (TIGR01451 family)